ncbi:hypothetical protein [Paenibacillus solanacearum]|uniref:hypothetical protein n=1 Tax=Paenibacillus solanacearum TaxID=2048548 RepID=UPI001C4041D5|nr:hypothetical protein [Paenibacillus solanacearum]
MKLRTGNDQIQPESEPDEQQQRHFLRPEQHEMKQLACHDLQRNDQDHGQQRDLRERFDQAVDAQSDAF